MMNRIVRNGRMEWKSSAVQLMEMETHTQNRSQPIPHNNNNSSMFGGLCLSVVIPIVLAWLHAETTTVSSFLTVTNGSPAAVCLLSTRLVFYRQLRCALVGMKKEK